LNKRLGGPPELVWMFFKRGKSLATARMPETKSWIIQLIVHYMNYAGQALSNTGRSGKYSVGETEVLLLPQHNLIWENFKIKASLLMRVFCICSLVYLTFRIIREHTLVTKI